MQDLKDVQIDTRLLSMTELTALSEQPRELVKIMMASSLLQPKAFCSRCGKSMSFSTRKSAADGCIWRCRESRNQDCSMKSIRQGTAFERAKLTLSDVLKLTLFRAPKNADGTVNPEIYRDYIVKTQRTEDDSNNVSTSLFKNENITETYVESPEPEDHDSAQINEVKTEVSLDESAMSSSAVLNLTDDDNVTLTFLVGALENVFDNPKASNEIKQEAWTRIQSRFSARLPNVVMTPLILELHYNMICHRRGVEGKPARFIAEFFYNEIKETPHTILHENVYDTSIISPYPKWLSELINGDPIMSKPMRQCRKRVNEAVKAVNTKKKRVVAPIKVSTKTTVVEKPQVSQIEETPTVQPTSEESDDLIRRRREEELHQARCRRDEELHQAQLKRDMELHKARLEMQMVERREVEARTQLTLIEVEIKRDQLNVLRNQSQIETSDECVILWNQGSQSTAN